MKKNRHSKNSALQRTAVQVFVSCLSLLFLVNCSPKNTPAGISIHINGAKKFQQIDGFGMNVNAEINLENLAR